MATPAELIKEEPDLRKTVSVPKKWSLLRQLLKSKGALLGLCLVGIFLLTAVAIALSDLLKITITPYNPLTEFLTPPLAAPSWAHIFGTDELGRDVLSRVLAAAPQDMGIGLAVVSVALAVGGTVGAYAGYTRGIVDEALMRVTDVFFALPGLVLAMVIAVILGPGTLNMTFVLMLLWWPAYARLARGETLKVAYQNYIEAARLSGLKKFKIIMRHVMPNVVFILLVYATLDIGTVVLVFAGLSYLGLAVTPPAPDWGQMVNAYQDYMIAAPWLPLFPGLVIALAVVGFSLLGDGLRDIFQVR